MPTRWNPASQATLLALALFLPAAAQQSDFIHPAADPSHKLTAADFLKDVAGNFAGLIHRDSLVPLLVGGATYGLATVPEQRLERHFARGDVWGAWADPGQYIGNGFVVAGVTGSLFALSRRSDNRRFRSLSYSLVQGFIVGETISHVAKPSFHRLRPNGEDHASFPSSHSMDTFMVATVFAEHYGWKAAIPAYAVAAYVGATRLEERKHHLTDVVAGSAIGYLVGKTVSRRMHNEKPSWFSIQVYPSGGGFVASVRLQLAPRDSHSFQRLGRETVHAN